MLLIVVLILLSSNFQAKNTMKIEDEVEPTCIGKIDGRVGNSKGLYYWEPYIFSKVDAEVKETRTGLLGIYRFFLPVNRYYNITANKTGFKPMTKRVYLSKDYPTIEVNFDFFESEPVEKKEVKNSKPTFYGMILGRISGVFEHASWFVGFTKLEFENRTKTSGFFGFYIIGFLEIDKIYSITAIKEGYSNETKVVKLTTKKPMQWINFYMSVNY